MKVPPWLPVYGDKTFRGPCPAEVEEQITVFAEIRRRWPDTLGILALHPRNEGKRNYRQYAKERAEGLATGAVDIVIPGNPSLVLELKRMDHTKCRLSDAELAYLRASYDAGAFVGVALGWEAALAAVGAWQACSISEKQSANLRRSLER